MIRLDFLANVPCNKQANNLLMHPFPHPNTLESATNKILSSYNAALARFFNKTHTYIFNFTSNDFLSLFHLLHMHGYSIALAVGLHQQSFYAGMYFKKTYKNLMWLIPNKDYPLITQKDISTIDKTSLCAFFLPIINQDILTINSIEEIIETILARHPNALVFLDISLFVSRLDTKRLQWLRIFKNKQILFLCNGESLGLMRPSGFMLSDYESQNAIFETWNQLNLLREGLAEAALCALESITKQKHNDIKSHFFDMLKSHLDERLSLFAPLELTDTNALPLRLKGIKARLLLQSLSIESIFSINGQDCLFGYAKPSFVLQSMGYDDAASRELISISFENLDSISLQQSVEAIAQAYKDICQF